MNNMSKVGLGVSLITVLGLGSGVSTAQAATTSGKVTFVGTISEEAIAGTTAFHARMRVRISGTCDSDGVTRDRWIHIRSGRMDGTFPHNGVNMDNAYGTLLAAMLSGKSVQIDGIASCSTTAVINMDLWAGNVGMF